MPHDIRAWAAKHNCKIDENGLLHVYKAVHKVNTKNGPRYISDYAVVPSLAHASYIVGLYRKACKQDIIEYSIGKNVEIDLHSLNTDPFEDCGSGLHFGSHRYAAAFGDRWIDLAIIECGVAVNDKNTKIVIPNGYNSGPSKIRTNKVTVLREIYSRAYYCYPGSETFFGFYNQEKAWKDILSILDGKE